MRYISLPPNHVQISSLLSHCATHHLLHLGSSIHASILKNSTSFSPQSLTILFNSLISLYSKCTHLSSSTALFRQMPFKDTVTWNSIISSHLINNETHSGFAYFKTMCTLGYKFDHATLTTILSICSKPGFLFACSMIHCLVVSNGFEGIVPVGNALVTAYYKCGSPGHARKVFDEMPERNVISWTAMISGLAQNQMYEMGLVLFREMRREVKANSLTYASALLACAGLRGLREGQEIHGLVVKSGFELDLCVESGLMDLYSKCGVIEDACLMFHSCGEPDEVSLTVMLVGFAQNGMEEQAFKLFVEMVGDGIEIDASMISSVLGAFDNSTPFAVGRQIHSLVIKKSLGENVYVCNGLINMYSKCGELGDSIEIFESMVQMNVVSWNSMIAAFARHGHGSEALQLFEKMELEGVVPTDITYLSLLNACSHVGSIEKGMEFLTSMSCVYGLTPRIEHYSCVVDMLGRAGLLKEAKDFIERLTIKWKGLLWQTLLGACGIHGDLEIGKYAAECLVVEEPDSPSAYVLLANIYSSEGKWEERAKIAKKMKEKGVKKETGASWIEVEKDIHSFVVEDKAHPESEAIYDVLWDLVALTREEDCVNNGNSALEEGSKCREQDTSLKLSV